MCLSAELISLNKDINNEIEKQKLQNEHMANEVASSSFFFFFLSVDTVVFALRVEFFDERMKLQFYFN